MLIKINFKNIFSHWKAFAFATFLFQAIRLPLMLLILPSIEPIEQYVVSQSLLLPIFFIANEVLLFHRSASGIRKADKAALFLIVFCTYLYISVSGSARGIWIFILLGLSAFIFSFSIGRTRERVSASAAIILEAFYSFFITLGFLLIAYFFGAEADVSHYLALLSICTATIVVGASFLLTYFLHISKSTLSKQGDSYDLEGHESSPDARVIIKDSAIDEPASTSPQKAVDNTFRDMRGLVILMAVSQVERALLGQWSPMYLVYISIAGGVLSGLRRLVGNDQIMFEKITKADSGIGHSLLMDIRVFNKVYGLAAGAAVCMFFMVLAFQKFTDFYFPVGSLSLSDLAMLLVFALYCSVSPVSIFLNGYLRLGRIGLAFKDWCTIIIWIIGLFGLAFFAVSELDFRPIVIIAASGVTESILFSYIIRDKIVLGFKRLMISAVLRVVILVLLAQVFVP